MGKLTINGHFQQLCQITRGYPIWSPWNESVLHRDTQLIGLSPCVSRCRRRWNRHSANGFLDGWSCSPTEWTGDHPSSYMYIECIYTYIYIYIYIYKNVEIRYLIIAAYVIYIYIYIYHIYIYIIYLNQYIYIYIFIDILLYQCIISAASLLHVRLGCDWVAATETDLAADATALGSEGYSGGWFVTWWRSPWIWIIYFHDI